MDLTETKTAGEDIFNGHVFSVHLDKVRIADGSIRKREVVEHRGGVGIVAIDDDGCVYMVRQYRYAVGKALLEIPAGKMEKGEEPLATAKRELSEETGFTAANWTPLGVMYPTPGYCSEALHIYMATGLIPGKQNLDDGEILTVEKIPMGKIMDMIMAGEIEDGKTVFGIVKAHILAEK